MADNDTIDPLADKIEAAQKADQQANAQAVQTEDKQAKIDELTEALQRSMADLQNYKRRAEEDKMRFVKFANADLLKKLLPTIDNFDRACQQFPEELIENSWAKGVVSTHDELMKALDAMGVKKMKTVGEKLDPSLHEAVMQDAGEQDVILEEFEPGYLLNDEVVKVAKVKVGNGS